MKEMKGCTTIQWVQRRQRDIKDIMNTEFEREKNQTGN